MYNYKIKTIFVSPEMPLYIFIFVENWIRYMIFPYGLEPDLIQQILIGFEAIMENLFLSLKQLKITQKMKEMIN